MLNTSQHDIFIDLVSTSYPRWNPLRAGGMVNLDPTRLELEVEAPLTQRWECVGNRL